MNFVCLHWWIVEWKEVNCCPNLFNKYLLSSLRHTIFRKLYPMFNRINSFSIKSKFTSKALKFTGKVIKSNREIEPPIQILSESLMEKVFLNLDSKYL